MNGEFGVTNHKLRLLNEGRMGRGTWSIIMDGKRVWLSEYNVSFCMCKRACWLWVYILNPLRMGWMDRSQRGTIIPRLRWQSHARICEAHWRSPRGGQKEEGDGVTETVQTQERGANTGALPRTQGIIAGAVSDDLSISDALDWFAEAQQLDGQWTLQWIRGGATRADQDGEFDGSKPADFVFEAGDGVDSILFQRVPLHQHPVWKWAGSERDAGTAVGVTRKTPREVKGENTTTHWLLRCLWGRGMLSLSLSLSLSMTDIPSIFALTLSFCGDSICSVCCTIYRPFTTTSSDGTARCRLPTSQATWRCFNDFWQRMCRESQLISTSTKIRTRADWWSSPRGTAVYNEGWCCLTVIVWK